MNGSAKTFRALLRLMRPEQVPTAAADSAAGAVVVLHVFGREQPLAAGAVIVASLLLYAGGMVFNDLAHVERDRRLHPDRPLPSGNVSPSSAFMLGAVLFVLGLISAGVAGWTALMVAAAVASGILLYNYGAATHTFFGPVLMALLRSGNFVLGLSAAGMAGIQWQPGVVLAVFVGLHILFVTLVSVLEERPRATFALKAYAICDAVTLVTLAVFLLWIPPGGQLVWWMMPAGFLPLLVYLAWLYQGVNGALNNPSASTIGRVVGTGVQGLILIHATIVAVLGQPLKGAALLLLFVPMLIARYT